MMKYSMNKRGDPEAYQEILNRLDELAYLIHQEKQPERTIKKYREALQDVVETLEATKSSFKSKQLKALRERIETVLNEMDSS